MMILAGSSKCPPNPPKLPSAAEGAQAALAKSLLEGGLGGLGILGAISGEVGRNKLTLAQPAPQNRSWARASR
jgi:hypothetical protein